MASLESTCDTTPVLTPKEGLSLPQIAAGDKGGGCGGGAGATLQLQLQLPLALSCQVLPAPRKEKKPKPKPPPPPKILAEKGTQPSLLHDLFSPFAATRRPQPAYFDEVDCVGLPGFLRPHECRRIMEHAEALGFEHQARERVLRMQRCDLLDEHLCQGLWTACGLGDFLQGIVVDGLAPCCLNDVIRIQKYLPGDFLGRHRDQPLQRRDGRCSKYSLRVFLNQGDFTGGRSAFHLDKRSTRPMSVQPEEGLALLYPQGDFCAVQEELEVQSGCKHVLRADVLFCKPEDVARYRPAV